MPATMWVRAGRFTGRLSRLFVIVSVVCFLIFVVSAARTFAATTYHVKVGGEVMGLPLARGGMAWFNGYDPAVIVIHPGDTVTWDLVGGVHTVTSTATLTNGSFVFDSSPLFTPAGALADMGSGMLLPPGSVYDLDTSSLAPGTYQYVCKIHNAMKGNLMITPGPVTSPIVNVVAGWGDHVYAVQAFAPENVTVAQGTTVRWNLMNAMEPHTITGFNATGVKQWDSSPNFNPPGPPPVMLRPGVDSFSVTFNNAGTFTYFCKVHAYYIGQSWVGMSGTVLVVPLTTADAVGSLSAVSYASLALAIVALVVAIYAVVRRKSEIQKTG